MVIKEHLAEEIAFVVNTMDGVQSKNVDKFLTSMEHFIYAFNQHQYG